MRSFLGLLSLLAITGSLRAATLLTYDFASAAATSNAPGVSGSSASWAGVTGAFGGSFNSASVTTNQLDTSLNTSKYITFTLSAAEGSVLNLESFSFAFGGSRSSGSATFGVNSSVRTDLGSYGTDLVLAPGDVTTATASFNSTTPNYLTYTADLSAPQYQGLTTLTFRLYGWTNTAGTSGLNLRFDNFAINGTVAPIPEPSTWLLLGGAGLFALWRRRRSVG